MSGLQKNTASQKYRVFAFDVTTGVAKTGDAANITAKIDKDWATATATNDVNPTEVEDGYYLFDLTQAETNADVIDFYPESATSNIQVIGVPGTVYTVPAAFSDNPTLTAAEVNAECDTALTDYGPLTPTVAGRTLDVTTAGEAGVDFGNVAGILTNANVAFVDANERVDLGSWLGIAVTYSATANKPEVDMYSISNKQAAADRLELFSEYGGYADGFAYIDTVGGDAGDVDYENATEDNHVSNLADLITVMTSVGLKKAKASPDSSITFLEGHVGQVWESQGATLVIGTGAGNDISKSHFSHFNTISGVGTSPSGEAHVIGGHVANLELGVGHLTGCALTGTYTLGSAGNHVLIGCYQEDGTDPVVDMNSLGGSHLSVIGHGGDLTINNILAGDTAELNGRFGNIILNGANATINISGTASSVTDNRTGTPLGTDSTIKASDIAAIEIDTQDLQAQIGTAGAGLTDLGGMSTGMKAEVNAECDTAIADADIATETKQDATDIVIGELATQGDTNESKIDAVKVDTAAAALINTEARLSELDPANLPADVAAVQTTADAIEVDTQDIQAQIGTAGDGLTNINLPNQTMDITGNITGNLSGSVGSVSGNVDGSVGSLGAQAKLDVNTEVDTSLSDYDGPTNAEMEARTPSAAELAYIVSNAADGPPVTFSGGTTTTAVIATVDGVAASTLSNDALNGRILVFPSTGTLKNQATDITDWDQGTSTATITAVTTAVTSSHTANLK